MGKQTFKLITLASLCLLLFSLYLNFLYKGDTSEFTPVKKSTTDSSILAHTGIQLPYPHIEPNAHIK